MIQRADHIHQEQARIDVRARLPLQQQRVLVLGAITGEQLKRAMREGHVGGTNPLPDGLWQNILADDLLFVGDEQVIGDRGQGGHLLLPLRKVHLVAVQFPSGLKDCQALIDQQKLMADGFGHGGGLGRQ